MAAASASSASPIATSHPSAATRALAASPRPSWRQASSAHSSGRTTHEAGGGRGGGRGDGPSDHRRLSTGRPSSRSHSGAAVSSSRVAGRGLRVHPPGPRHVPRPVTHERSRMMCACYTYSLNRRPTGLPFLVGGEPARAPWAGALLHRDGSCRGEAIVGLGHLRDLVERVGAGLDQVGAGLPEVQGAGARRQALQLRLPRPRRAGAGTEVTGRAASLTPRRRSGCARR